MRLLRSTIRGWSRKRGTTVLLELLFTVKFQVSAISWVEYTWCRHCSSLRIGTDFQQEAEHLYASNTPVNRPCSYKKTWLYLMACNELPSSGSLILDRLDLAIHRVITQNSRGCGCFSFFVFHALRFETKEKSTECSLPELCLNIPWQDCK